MASTLHTTDASSSTAGPSRDKRGRVKLSALRSVIRPDSTASLKEPTLTESDVAAILEQAGFTPCMIETGVPIIGMSRFSTDSGTSVPETETTDAMDLGLADMGDLGQKLEQALGASVQLTTKSMEQMVSKMSNQVARVLEENQARSVSELVVLRMKLDKLKAVAKEREAEVEARMSSMAAYMNQMNSEIKALRSERGSLGPLLINAAPLLSLALLGGTSLYMALCARRQRTSRTSA